MRYRDLMMSGATRLVESGRPRLEAARDARLLMQHAAGIDHARLISRDGEEAPATIAEMFEAAIGRRAAGEPVSRIIGRREFFGLEFEVTPDVLDPRPETELLVGQVLADHPRGGEGLVFADIGTGSGAIAVALLTNLPGSRCVASDVSPHALDVASANARRHGVGERFSAVRSHYLGGLEGPFDFIVSNPPYIRTSDIEDLSDEVRLHDPHIALDGGADGLDAYRKLLSAAGDFLKPGGHIYLEMGLGQADALRGLATALGWHAVEVAADLAGIERVLTACRQRQYASP